MLKDLLSFLIMPYSFTLIMIMCGLIMIQFMDRRRHGMIVAFLGLIGLYFFGSYAGVSLLVKPLENPYPPILELEHFSELSENPPPVIVVMGSGHYTSDKFPAINQLSNNAVHRMNEGLRLHQWLPGSTLVLLGGSLHNEVFTSELQFSALLELGIDTTGIRVLTGALNSEEEAIQVRNFINQEFNAEIPLVLVTSATHMHRSLKLYQAAGLDPIPAASNHYLQGPPKSFWNYLSWSPGRLEVSHRAVHEYFGIVWSTLRGRA